MYVYIDESWRYAVHLKGELERQNMIQENIIIMRYPECRSRVKQTKIVAYNLLIILDFKVTWDIFQRKKIVTSFRIYFHPGDTTSTVLIKDTIT